MASINRLLRFVGIICAQFVGVEPQAGPTASCQPGPGHWRPVRPPCSELQAQDLQARPRMHLAPWTQHVLAPAACEPASQPAGPMRAAGQPPVSWRAGAVPQPLGRLAAPGHCAGPVGGRSAAHAGRALQGAAAAHVHLRAPGAPHSNVHGAPRPQPLARAPLWLLGTGQPGCCPAPDKVCTFTCRTRTPVDGLDTTSNLDRTASAGVCAAWHLLLSSCPHAPPLAAAAGHLPGSWRSCTPCSLGSPLMQAGIRRPTAGMRSCPKLQSRLNMHPGAAPP